MRQNLIKSEVSFEEFRVYSNCDLLRISGDISFYNKMIGETGMQDHPHSDIHVVVAKMMAMHDEQFGETN